MSDHTPPPPPPGPEPGPPPSAAGPGPEQQYPTAPRRLRRSATDRKVSGVCGGLGEHFAIDPVIFRVMFPVLTIFAAGLGLLAYGILWLALPEGGEAESGAERAVAGRFDNTLWVPAAAALAGFLILINFFGHGPGNLVGGLLLLGLFALVFTVLRRRQDRRLGRASGQWTPSQWHGVAPVSGAGAPGAWWAQQPGAPPGTPPAGAAEPTTPVGNWQQAGPPPYQQPGPVGPRRPRERSSLTWAVLSLALIVAGVLLAAGVAKATVLATVLLVLGLGLVVVAWVGRAKLLILPALLLSLILGGSWANTELGDPLRHGGPRFADVVWAPKTVPPAGFRGEFGDALLDLRELAKPTGAQTLTARLNGGTLHVLLPRDLPVNIRAHARFGSVDLPGHEEEGGRVQVARTLPAPDAPTAPALLTLDLTVGAGEIDVDHVDVPEPGETPDADNPGDPEGAVVPAPPSPGALPSKEAEDA